jgi:hypothetical protein
MDRHHTHRALVAALALGLLQVTGAWAADEPPFEVLERDDQGLTLSFALEAPDLHTITTAVGDHDRLTVPGAGVLFVPGAPDVPVIREILAIPDEALPLLTVVDAEVETWTLAELGIERDWMPVQVPVAKRPGDQEARSFVRRDDIYATDAFYPGELARLGDEGRQRGVRHVLLEVFPIQLNPAAGLVEVVRTVTIRVDFEDPGPIGEGRHGSHPASHAIDTTGAQGYLIVSHDLFADAVRPFADFKRRQGYDVTLVLLSETGSTREEIRDHIAQLYAEADVPPTFLLLVGDTGFIPHFVGPESLAATDLYYATMDGPDDLHPDLLVGRFPVNTVAEAELLVDKTLGYLLLDPYGSTDWIRRASFAASLDEFAITEGSHDYCIDAHLAPRDFECSRRYTVSQAATTEELLADVDAGLSQLTFSGHGWFLGWLDGPPVTFADLPDRGNAGMLPFVQSYACETGMYEYDSFMEAWVLAPNGAIASWGSSTAAYFDQDDVLQRAVYDTWFGGEDWLLRSALNQGIRAVWEHFGGEEPSRDYFEQYNLFGDPSLDLWTSPPRPLEVDVLAPVTAGMATVVLGVTDGETGEPVEGALACLDLDGRFHAVGRTDAHGAVTLLLGDGLVPGETLDLMVSGHDLQTHEGWVEADDGQQDAADDPAGGCTCTAVPGRSRAPALLAAGLLGILLARRRRFALPGLFLASALLVSTGCSETVEVQAGDLEDAVGEITATLHPDVRSVVLVSWTQLAAHTGWVEYSFDEGIWHRSPTRDLAEGSRQELLLGIPYSTDVTLRLALELGDTTAASDEVSITTDSPPSSIPAAVVLTSDPSRWDSDSPFLLAGLEDATVILDRLGRVVWAFDTPARRIAMHPQVSHDGDDLLIDHGSFWATYDDGDASEVLRVKIDGSVVQTYATKGLHHPFAELGDGSIVWSAVEGGNETIQRLTPQGEQLEIASCIDLVGVLGGEGYCGSNTLRWNEPTDTLLYSLYSHETVVELDVATGQPVRIFGHHSDAWSFDPDGSAFWWQHGADYTSTGTLLLSSHRSDGDDELVVREYELDDASRTLRQVWTFGAGEDVHSRYMGEAHRLPGGNTLHNYGSNPRLREVAPDGAVVWDLFWPDAEGDWELGRTTPIEDLYAFTP